MAVVLGAVVNVQSCELNFQLPQVRSLKLPYLNPKKESVPRIGYSTDTNDDTCHTQMYYCRRNGTLKIKYTDARAVMIHPPRVNTVHPYIVQLTPNQREAVLIAQPESRCFAANSKRCQPLVEHPC